MQFTTISSTNQKGQFVIPVFFRKQLGITPNTPLQISLKGNILQVVPVRGVITLEESESSYVDILKKTQGSWATEAPKDLLMTKKKRALELEASKKRKQSW